MSREYPTHEDRCVCSGCHHSNIVESVESRVRGESEAEIKSLKQRVAELEEENRNLLLKNWIVV